MLAHNNGQGPKDDEDDDGDDDGNGNGNDDRDGDGGGDGDGDGDVAFEVSNVNAGPVAVNGRAQELGLFDCTMHY
ncbi:GD24446 [Drosophila simulans]|uniref:GD24446 n=1 Tax=Drosophila simulans TaxID=7240 RepID=B4NUT1_DROSI|nr:GD24446 [Drosophila simulans]